MQATVAFNAPLLAGKSSVVTLTATEQDLLVISDGNFLKKSQITNYIKTTIGSGSTYILIGYYYSPDDGVTWYKAALRSATTNILADLPTKIDSTSPTSVIDNIAFSAATRFKITAKADAGTLSTAQVTVFLRDN